MKMQKVCLACEGAYGLHVSPSRKTLDATKNTKQTDVFQVRYFFIRNTKMFDKRPPQCVQMSDFILVVGPLGAPVAPLFETCTKKCSKICPKTATKPPKGPQNGKSESQVLENIKK